jgi:hypothetical protein
LPAGSEAGAAPVWLFAAALLAPLIVAATVWRRLERQRPADEQGALATGAATGLGFAATAWLVALVSRIVVLASVSRATTDSFDAPQIIGRPVRQTVGAFVAARPNPAAVLGLALFWGLAGGFGAAFLWAAKHNARWQIAGGPVPSDYGVPAAPSPPEPAWLLPETPPTPVPPPEPPAGPAQTEGPVGGTEGSVRPGVEPPGGKP